MFLSPVSPLPAKEKKWALGNTKTNNLTSNKHNFTKIMKCLLNNFCTSFLYKTFHDYNVFIDNLNLMILLARMDGEIMAIFFRGVFRS